MKLSALFISGLTLLAASAASADSFVSIAVTGASSATVTNRWLIGSGLSGLGYIDGNGGYSSATVATNFYTITGAAIPAGGNPLGFTSYLKTGDPTPQSSVGNSLTPDSYSGLTYVAANLGLISSLSFYTIHHRATGDYLALIQPATPTVSDQKPMSTSGGPSTAGATGYFALSYADDDPGLWGANLFYYLRTNSLGETVFGSMIPALLSGPTDRWNLGAGKGYTDLAYTSTATISGNPQYTQQFYYLRLDPVTHTSFLGKINPATGVATDIQNLGAVYRTLTFTTTDVGYGPNNFYAIAQPAAQTISFAPIPDHTACDAPFTFVAPTATSGLPVTVTASGPATLSAGNVVTLTGVPGTVTLTATQAGNSSFNPAVPLALSFTVTACAPGLTAQTITFAPLANHTACDAPFSFVYPTASSGLPVTVTVSGPATVSGGNVVTLTGTSGTVTLTATQAGNSSFNPAAAVAQSFTVAACAPGLTAQTITFAPLANHTACDAPFSFVYPTASSGLPVTVTVSGPATVSAGNVVTLTGTSGTVTLTATQAGNSSFNPAAAVAQSFTVAACAPGLTAQTITFAPLANHTACDAPFSFVYPTATSGLPVTLAVSGPASVSGGNVVTLTGATGTVTLVATQAGNGTFAAAAPVTQHFAVSSCAVALAPQTISFAPVADHTACDVAFSFVYPVASSGLPVTVVATGPATVSAGNVITLSGVPGVVTLTATQAGNAITSPAAPVTISFAVAACGAVPVITSPHDVQAGGQPVSPNVLYGVVGVPFPPYTITATNLPTTFSAVNLPPGLSLNPLTGSITGTPTVADTWFVTIGATNPSGTGTATLIIVVRSAAIPQTITFAPIPSHTACDSPFTFVYPTASSGLPVTVAVTGPATVTAGNVVSVTGVGTVTLTASQGGNDTSFQAAPNVVQTFTVTACPPTPVITSPHDVQAGGKPVSENVVTGTVGTPITPIKSALRDRPPVLPPPCCPPAYP
jgi:hypothetical protein